tara:strand:- start:172 stop:909 length:738 start_codon:yes stop_codon:yes gene_type:complete
MPTTNITAAATGGLVRSNVTSTGNDATDFATARNKNTADVIDLTDNADGVGSVKTTGRGATTFSILRLFHAFDTSGITSGVTSVTLQIERATTSDCDIIVVKASKPDTSTDLVLADFDAIPGFTDDASMSGNVTEYSSEIVEGTIGTTRTDVTLNSTAISDVQSLDTFAIAIIEHTHDYSNVTPTDGSAFVFFEGVTGVSASEQPRLVVVTSDGYTHNVMGVAAANIAKVDGVATANIGKINGVD